MERRSGARYPRSSLRAIGFNKYFRGGRTPRSGQRNEPRSNVSEQYGCAKQHPERAVVASAPDAAT